MKTKQVKVEFVVDVEVTEDGKPFPEMADIVSAVCEAMDNAIQVGCDNGFKHKLENDLCLTPLTVKA